MQRRLQTGIEVQLLMARHGVYRPQPMEIHVRLRVTAPLIEGVRVTGGRARVRGVNGRSVSETIPRIRTFRLDPAEAHLEPVGVRSEPVGARSEPVEVHSDQVGVHSDLAGAHSELLDNHRVCRTPKTNTNGRVSSWVCLAEHGEARDGGRDLDDGVG